MADEAARNAGFRGLGLGEQLRCRAPHLFVAIGACVAECLLGGFGVRLRVFDVLLDPLLEFRIAAAELMSEELLQPLIAVLDDLVADGLLDSRKRAEQDRPIWYLVPDGVVQYVAKRRLYAAQPVVAKDGER